MTRRHRRLLAGSAQCAEQGLDQRPDRAPDVVVRRLLACPENRRLWIAIAIPPDLGGDALIGSLTEV
jgi:hypothetical protein